MKPGSHRVEIVLEPLSFKIGLVVSVLTIVALLIGWVVSNSDRWSRFTNR